MRRHLLPRSPRSRAALGPGYQFAGPNQRAADLAMGVRASATPRPARLSGAVARPSRVRRGR